MPSASSNRRSVLNLAGSLLRSLAKEFGGPGVIGIGLAGSFARGQGSGLSDIDLNIFLRKPPRSKRESYMLHYRKGYLVSVKRVGLETTRSSLKEPQLAIWAVPGLRQMQLLYDPTGKLAELQSLANTFAWHRLEKKAREFACYQLLTAAEEVHKILAGTQRNDPSKIVYAAVGLTLSLTEAVAVHKGLLIESENAYFAQVQASMGKKSSWTQAHNLAIGIKAGAAFRKGVAALQLYWQTFRALEDLVPEAHYEVLQPTLGLIRRSGYLDLRL